jgi:hypothetical protein
MVAEVLPDGSVLGPDAVVFRRTPRNLSKKECEAFIASGTPVLTEMWPEPLTWLDGVDATGAWAEIAPQFGGGTKRKNAYPWWQAHLWESDDGRPLVRFDGRH